MTPAVSMVKARVGLEPMKTIWALVTSQGE